MRRTLSLAALACLALGAISLAFVKDGWTQLSYLAGIRLQPNSPGIPDAGHANVSGTLLAGRIGVGTNTPGMSIEATTPSYYGEPAIGAAAGSSYAYLLASSPFQHSLIWDSAKSMRFGTETSRGTGYAEHMRIHSNGNVGIGQQFPSYRLDVQTPGNTGLRGYSQQASGVAFGGYFQSDSTSGRGLYSEASASSGVNFGGYFKTNSSDGSGIYAEASATSGATYGGYFVARSPQGTSVFGSNVASSGTAYGILGRSSSAGFGSAGIRGENTSTGQVIGVEGIGLGGDAGTGIAGRGTATGGYFESFGPAGGFASSGVYAAATDYGVYAETSGIAAGRFVADSTAHAVHGSLFGSGVGAAGRFENAAPLGDAIYAFTSGGDFSLAVAATSNSSSAVRGESYGTGAHIGVYGQNTSSASPFSWGVYAAGRLGANGAKLFQIDHPLDPENKALQHYCAEGDAPRLSYAGRETLDANGEAWAILPDYFEAINRDPEYQLTCIGGYAPVYIAQEVTGNRFKIAGGSPGLRVSWRVEGIRNDLYVRRHGVQTEIAKPERLKGKYISPELYDLPKEVGLYYVPQPREPKSAPRPRRA